MEKTSSISRRDFLKLMSFGAGAMALNPRVIEGSGSNPKIADVLDANVQSVLAAKAQSLIRPTPDGAVTLADYLRNSTQSSAGNICGPLAMAQQKWIVNHGVRVEDYFEAPPPNKFELAPGFIQTKMYGMFDEAFSPQKFDKFVVTTPLADYDFSKGQGVQPGDFFFFRARVGHGNNSHMMTISRRGADGVVYAITNYPDSNGKWIVKEVPFWNPKNPGASWVRELAAGQNTALFASGDGGFYQYRLKSFATPSIELMDHSAKAETFRTNIDSLARGATGEWHILVKNMNTGKIIAENASRKDYHAASVFKVPLAMVYLSYLESLAKDENDFNNILKNQGFERDTYYHRLHEMLVKSDEGATGKIAEFLLQQRVDRQGIIQALGGEDTNLNNRHSNCEDIGRLFDHIFDYKTFRFQSTHQVLIDLLSEYTDEDRTRLGKLKFDPSLALNIKRISDKRGSIALDTLEIAADAGRVEVVDKNGVMTPYFVYFAGKPRDGQSTDYKLLDAEMNIFIKSFADYLKG